MRKFKMFMAAALIASMITAVPAVSWAEGTEIAAETAMPIAEETLVSANIKASGTGDRQVTVTWDKVPGATAYIVYGKTGKNGIYHQLEITAYTKYVQNDASNDEWNFYWVYPYVKDPSTGVITTGKSGDYAYGMGTNGVVTEKLPTVAKVSAVGDGQGVNLTWNAVEGAEGYIIYTKSASEIGSHYLSMRTHAGSGASATKYKDTEASRSEYNFYWIFPYYTLDGKKIITTDKNYVYAKAKSILSVTPTDIVLQKGETITVDIVFEAVGGIKYAIALSNIASVSFSRVWEGTKTGLVITGEEEGTTTVTVTNTYNSEYAVINVTVIGETSDAIDAN